MESLYGQSYAELEVEWLEYLDSLSPTPEQAEAWGFNVRYFDLMRRYQTELDANARILPDAPTDWTSNTLSIFTRRMVAPVNVVFETALIAAQERADRGDMAGAECPAGRRGSRAGRQRGDDPPVATGAAGHLRSTGRPGPGDPARRSRRLPGHPHAG